MALACVVASCAYADVILPAVLTDHMVVQRGLPVHIWGKAAPGEAVSVTMRGETRTVTASPVGFWSVYLPPVAAGGPYEIAVKGANNAITLKDVLGGDVWVASGQSNMQMELKSVANAPAEIAAANYPQIRLFEVKNNVASYPLDDVEAPAWAWCTPETAPNFSAAAYFFGRHLHQKLGVPIGLIESSWGGTPLEAWASLRAISRDASLMPVFAAWTRMNDGAVEWKLRREQQLNEWKAAVEKAKAAGTTPPGYPWAGNERGEWAPAGLYNALIAPLTRFPIRGAIWYQGESNASKERAPVYAHLFEAMIQDWRRAWGVGNFPFLFVQLANFKTSPDAKWPELREAQLETLALANTGMAVTIDIGDPNDIHPKNKQDVGLRLALAARALAYGEKIEYSGPIFRQATPEGGALRVWFDHAASLEAKGGALKGFEIAGADRKYVPAEARIDGATVVVSSAAVAAPAYVRYAWADDPECNLYNGEGLPASPFRSE
ncbi:MAG: sialate O-acetylesterase [Acidobacteriota bacterium]